MKDSQYITVPEAAEILGISRPSMHKLLDDGAIEYTRPLKHRRVKVGDVKRYLAEQTHRRAIQPVEEVLR